jgi:hypothetical protein
MVYLAIKLNNITKPHFSSVTHPIFMKSTKQFGACYARGVPHSIFALTRISLKKGLLEQKHIYGRKGASNAPLQTLNGRLRT